MCDRVGMLYAGKLVEEGTTADVFAKPRHPYTVGLLRCLPREGRSKETSRLDTIPGSLPLPGSVTQGCIFASRCKLADERCLKNAPPPYRIAAAHGDQMSRCHYHKRAESLPRATDEAPVPVAALDAPALALWARNLSKTFRVGDEDVRAVHDVSLDLVQGETLGLVGESGSGKTTLAKLLLGLVAPDKGAMLELDGKSLPGRVTHRSEEQVKSLQIVFQNPDSALNRAHSVRQLIARSLTKLAALHGKAKEKRLQTLTEAVRLPERYLGQRMRQLSGGLKQRVAIARAIRAWWCATSRPRRSMCRCRRRFSICWRTCSASGA